MAGGAVVVVVDGQAAGIIAPVAVGQGQLRQCPAPTTTTS
jgi:hypothetical protein